MNVLDIEARQWMREESMREIAPKALTLAERILEAAAELDATLKDIEDAQNYLNCWVTEFREGTEAQTIRAYRKASVTSISSAPSVAPATTSTSRTRTAYRRASRS